MLQSSCRPNTPQFVSIKSQHVIQWNSTAWWEKHRPVSASHTAFTLIFNHCTGWIPSVPSSSSLSPAVICSTPQPAPQTLCPESQRRPASAPPTASPLYTPSAQTPASPWRWDVKNWGGWVWIKGNNYNAVSNRRTVLPYFFMSRYRVRCVHIQLDFHHLCPLKEEKTRTTEKHECVYSVDMLFLTMNHYWKNLPTSNIPILKCNTPIWFKSGLNTLYEPKSDVLKQGKLAYFIFCKTNSHLPSK